MVIRTSLFSLLFWFSGSFLFAQDGAIDLTFNPGDAGFGLGDGASQTVSSNAIQSDGKIIIGGIFTFYNGTSRNRIARLNADGTLDVTFNPGTGSNGDIRTISIQSDGKIIIAGDLTNYNGTSRIRIARLNADGTLDATFDPGTGANGTIWSSSLQSDGKIIIGGDFTSYNGTSINRIARINADGTLDATFIPGTGASAAIRTTSIQNDGKIIIGGAFTTYNGTGRNRIARLNADGTLDISFNPGTGAGFTVYSTAIQSDAKIIIGGLFTTYNGTARNYIARINTDGTLDAGFNPGTGANNFIVSASIQSDGKIIIGGQFTSYNGTGRNYIARINANGTLDVTFDPGTGTNGPISSTSLQSDGKIIIGGSFISYNGLTRNYIARINANGTLDVTFNPGTGANGAIRTSAIQSDGKIIIGGDFTTYNATGINRIARLNADGTLDVTFNPGTGVNNHVFSISIQSDGKIIIGGFFTTCNGTNRNYIARLNADGTLDVTFNPGTGANNAINSTSLQSDGKIIIGGAFTTYNGTGINRIARLNADGTLDATFNPGTGANNTIYSISLQSDGKIIIGGDFTSYNGTGINRIARLNADGTLDATFNPGTGANVLIFSTSIQSDGKIIIGGGFTSYNGTGTNYIARLNADGTLDVTFNAATGANNVINSTYIQSDGKILIGGSFTSYDGTGRNRIARLNADGTLDVTFDPGTGASAIVYTISIQSDGKIIIGGSFNSYNGTGRNRVTRLLLAVLPIELLYFTARPDENHVILQWATASETQNSLFTIERSLDQTQWESIIQRPNAGNGSTTQYYEATDINPFTGGTSWYRLKQTGLSGTVEYSNVVAVRFESGQEIHAAVYPNPAQDQVVIDLAPDTSPVSVNIFSIEGKLVYSQQVDFSGPIVIDAQPWQQGVYFIRLSTGEINRSLKLVKQ